MVQTITPSIYISHKYEHHNVKNDSSESQRSSSTSNKLVSPGEVITSGGGYMRGHGTYHRAKDDTLVASLTGYVHHVDKLICVISPRSKYIGEVGDVVVGRIVEVQQKRWKVDVQSRLHANLLLSSVNLPGGELRRRSEEDALAMRNYLVEGDLISAEIQAIYADGSIFLHTRSLKYGKLGQGSLVSVSSSLIKRRKTHFHKLSACGGAQVIIGNNGQIWIKPPDVQYDTDVSMNESCDLFNSTLNSSTSDVRNEQGGFTQDMTCVSISDREVVARLRNCILALANFNVSIWDTSIIYAYECSLIFHLNEMIKPEIMTQIATLTENKLDIIEL